MRVRQWTFGWALGSLASGLLVLGCGGGGGDPSPTPRFGALAGKSVLVLPVQYVEPGPGGWPGGSLDASGAARLADSEIEFALHERRGRAAWVLPRQQIELLERRPSFEIDPYALPADELRDAGGDLRRTRDPLYGQIRSLAALFDARYVVWPLEVFYDESDGAGTGRMAIRVLLLDARGGDILWRGAVYGRPMAAGAAGALATAAQAFAVQVTP